MRRPRMPDQEVHCVRFISHQIFHLVEICHFCHLVASLPRSFTFVTIVIMKKHTCKLNYNTQLDILELIIDQGIFVNLRRKLKRFSMLSPSHPMAALYYRSTTSRLHEDFRHMAKYKWVIHPYSMFSFYWEMFIFLVYASQFVILAVVAAANVYFTKLSPIVIAKLTTDYLLTVDIVKHFFTGYYDTRNSRAVLNFSSIAWKYLTSFFLLDLLCCMHAYLVPFRLIFADREFYEMTWEVAIAFKMIASFRILRIQRWLNALNLFGQYTNMSNFLNKAIRDMMIFSTVLVWLYIINFQIEYFIETHVELANDTERNAPIYKRFYITTLKLFHVSYGGQRMRHQFQVYETVLFMYVGYCLQMSMYAQIMQVWTKFTNSKSKNDNLLQQFTEFINYKELPIGLRKRFFSFYQFKFQNRYYNEEQINSMTSSILQREILVYVTKNHVQRVEFFHDLPDHLLSKIVSKLKSEIYLANDVIIKAGLPGTCMFFIYFGTVAIYTPSGREICHLEDGAHFGEIALLYNEPRVATVVAVTPCELFVLKRSDFLQVLEPFPEYKKRIITLADERMRLTVFH